MIVYFSGNANYEFAAKRLSTECEDVAISTTEIEEKICLREGESLGVITPCYYWGLSSIVEEFLDKFV